MVEQVKGAAAAPLSHDAPARVTAADLDAVSALALVAFALTERASQLVSDAGFEGLRPAHGRLFGRLQDGPRTVSELARDLDVTPQAISKTLKPLVAGGYVVVERGSDARSRVVRLADRGWRAILGARAARRAVVENLDLRVGGRLQATVPLLVDLLEDLGLLDEALDRRTFRA